MEKQPLYTLMCPDMGKYEVFDYYFEKNVWKPTTIMTQFIAFTCRCGSFYTGICLVINSDLPLYESCMNTVDIIPVQMCW